MRLLSLVLALAHQGQTVDITSGTTTPHLLDMATGAAAGEVSVNLDFAAKPPARRWRVASVGARPSSASHRGVCSYLAPRLPRQLPPHHV